MNLPTKITVLRIILIPVFIALLIIEFPNSNWYAAIVFTIVALSDAVDGYLARKKKLITNMGKLLDPIADKLLVASALIFLTGKGIDAWMTFIIIGRELLVTGWRLAAIEKGITIAASNSGKIKTIVQMVAIVAVLIKFPGNWYFMLAAVLITIYSGAEHLLKTKNVWKD